MFLWCFNNFIEHNFRTFFAKVYYKLKFQNWHSGLSNLLIYSCATARELHTISLYFEMKQDAKIDEKNEIFIFIGSNSLIWNNSCKFIFLIILNHLKETNEN